MHYRRRLKFFLLKVLRLHSTPHKVALGFALGSVINFLPTFGFALPLAAFTAGLFRLNIIAAIIGDLIFKPLFPVFLYLDFRVGYMLFGKDMTHTSADLTNLISFKASVLRDLGAAFFYGMLFNLLLFTICIYIITFTIFKYYRLPLLRSLRDSKMLN